MKPLFFGFRHVTARAVALTYEQAREKRIRFLGYLYNEEPRKIKSWLKRSAQVKKRSSSA